MVRLLDRANSYFELVKLYERGVVRDCECRYGRYCVFPAVDDVASEARRNRIADVVSLKLEPCLCINDVPTYS